MDKSGDQILLVAGWQQALTLFVLVIPGFVYQGYLARLRGPRPEDGDLGTRIVRALAASGVFALVYVIALGPVLTKAVIEPRVYIDNARWTAAGLLALIFGVPALSALIHHAWSARRSYPPVPWMDLFQVYNATPTAWDFAVNRVAPGYVRVLTKDGNWVGGYAGKESFYSSYPEPREIYVETAWELNDDGDFERMAVGSTGRWIRCEDAVVVDFVAPQDSSFASTPLSRAEKLISIGLVVSLLWRRVFGTDP